MTSRPVMGWVMLAIIATILLAFGVTIGRACRSTYKGPEIIGKVDTVPDTILVASRPKIVTKWKDRIVIKTVPVRVVVSEGVPDTAFALRYARRALAADSARRADSLARQPAPVLPPASGTYDGKRLTLWLTRSDGSLLTSSAKIKPQFAFFAGYDKGSDTLPLYQSDRWFVRLARDAKNCSIPTAVLAVIGGLVNHDDHLAGALIGGSAGFVGCLAG